MFMVGFFVTICSAIRLQSITKIQKSLNPTYDYLGWTTWSTIEGSASIICACMPGVANAIKRYWPKFMNTYAQTKQSWSSSNGGQSFSNGDNDQQPTVAPPNNIRSKTTVSISYADARAMPSNVSTRSDELELTPASAYIQHEVYTRYSSDSSRGDRKHGFTG